MKYEKIENIYKRKSTRKNSKWTLDYTNAKEITKEELQKILNDFDNCPLEKHIEEYEGIRKNGTKYYSIDKLIKREIIIIQLD